MKAFVTGATGLLGTNLIQALRAGGHQVKGLIRDPQKGADVFGGMEVQLVQGDMREVDKFAGSLAGSDVLFHTAAYFREYYQPGQRSDDEMRRINVTETLKLYLRAEQHGIHTIVHVSSSGVIGLKPGGAPGDETTPPGPDVQWNRYFHSKLEAERAIAELQKGRAQPLRIVQILPGWMFGPNDRGPTGSGQLVLNYLKRRIYASISGGSNSVDVRDVANTMIVAADKGRSGEKYIVGGTYLTFDRIMADLEQISGIRSPRFQLPHRLALFLAGVSFQYGRIMKRDVLVTPETVRLMHAELRVDSGKAERELGATFRPFLDTLRDEVEWFRANGHV